MTNKELKKLSRAELLEMLVEQSELCDELQKKLDKALSELQNRNITIYNAGTLAEAAAKLSGVFEAADQAAALYLENIQRMAQEVERIHSEHIAAAQKEAEKILHEAQIERMAILNSTETADIKTDNNCKND